MRLKVSDELLKQIDNDMFKVNQIMNLVDNVQQIEPTATLIIVEPPFMKDAVLAIIGKRSVELQIYEVVMIKPQFKWKFRHTIILTLLIELPFLFYKDVERIRNYLINLLF